MHIMEFFLDTL